MLGIIIGAHWGDHDGALAPPPLEKLNKLII